jgi:5-(carboxyamino)imidazole ribonucleotide mutase
MKKVAILMGSDSDLPVMKEAAVVLEEFGIPYFLSVSSAHRTPEKTIEFAKNAEKEFDVIIAGAGGAAHLAGVIAAMTRLPVIGVPIKSPALNGVDSLYSTVQMPGGVVVATVGIGNAKNAGLLAAQIIGIKDEGIAQKVLDYKEKQKSKVLEKAKNVEELGWKDYLNKNSEK